MPETLETIADKITALGRSIEQRFGRVDHHFATVDRHFGKVDEQLSSVDQQRLR